MEEDYKLFQLIRRNPINNCVDLSKNMIGKRSGFIYFTENFRIDFENKMANQARLQEENKRYKSENETLKCSIAVANKLEELIKEDFIPKGKIVDIIEKISVYKKLAKESIEQRIVIADSDSLEYGKMQAHNVDVSMLQELLESEETNDKNNKKG